MLQTVMILQHALTWDTIKGDNTDIGDVKSALTLPQCMTNSARTAWSEITWSSSEPDVISLKEPEINAIINPVTGEIHAPAVDTEVTLTAIFTANDTGKIWLRGSKNTS